MLLAIFKTTCLLICLLQLFADKIATKLLFVIACDRGQTPLDAYLGAPQLDSPVERRSQKQMGIVQRSCSRVAVDPCDGAVMALKHLTNARFAVSTNTKTA